MRPLGRPSEEFSCCARFPWSTLGVRLCRVTSILPPPDFLLLSSSCVPSCSPSSSSRNASLSSGLDDNCRWPLVMGELSSVSDVIVVVAEERDADRKAYRVEREEEEEGEGEDDEDEREDERDAHRLLSCRLAAAKALSLPTG